MKPIIVISHERSGTHFLINTIAMNFGRTHEVINLPNGNPSSFIANSWTEPERIRKSHHQAWWFSANLIQETVRNYSVFYVIRDCRGMLVSLFHYTNAASKFDRAFQKFDSITQLIGTTPGNDIAYSKFKCASYPERWAAHIDSWEPYFKDICVVTYADLSLRHTETVWRIAAHLKAMPVGDVRRPGLKEMYTVMPYRGVYCGWKEEMCQGDSSRVLRMIGRQRRWATD